MEMGISQLLYLLGYLLSLSGAVFTILGFIKTTNNMIVNQTVLGSEYYKAIFMSKIESQNREVIGFIILVPLNIKGATMK